MTVKLPIALMRRNRMQRDYDAGIARAPHWDFAPKYIRDIDDYAEVCSRHDDTTVFQATRNRFYYRGVLIWRVAGTDAEEHPIAAWDGDTSPYYEVNVRLSPFPHHSVHRFVTLKQAVYFLVHANLGKQIPLLQSEALPKLRQGKGYNLKVIL